MIKCPLCNKEVFLLSNTPFSSDYIPIEDDDETTEFNCLSTVKLGSITYYHYFRRKYFYAAIIPPFRIQMNGNVLQVYQASDNNLIWDSLPQSKVIYELTNADRQDFEKVAKRFQNLQVFS
jgi:hypothetical protein